MTVAPISDTDRIESPPLHLLGSDATRPLHLLDPRQPETRLAALADPGTLHITSRGATVVTARAEIAGVAVRLFATDPRHSGGAVDLPTGTDIARTVEEAARAGEPVIGVWESGGARMDTGASSLHGMGLIFAAVTRASGRVLQLSVVLGAAAGGAAYGPALTDLVILGPRARVFVTGPDVVRTVTGEEADAYELGGVEPHSRTSGLAQVVTDSDEAALLSARTLVELLAGGAAVPLPRPADRVDPGTFLPLNPRRAYDIRPVITALLDGPPVELSPRYAPNLVCALGRLAGRSVGVLANNPLRRGGCLDSASAEKAARFVRLCDSRRVPLVVLVDTPGFLPGVRQEHDGVVRRGAKLLHAFADATVPRVTVVLRKAYGGAYIAMNASSLGATAVLAWPDAQIGVMGELPAVRLLNRREIAAADPAERDELETRLAQEYRERCASLTAACRDGLVDEVIEPAQTRGELCRILAAAPVPVPEWPTRNIPL